MRRAGSQQRAGDRKMSDGRLNRLKSGAIDETKKLFGIFLYFWILLSLFSLHKALVLNDESLVYHQGFAVINALALAKVVLLGEMFHAGDRLKGKPLIYPIVFKSAVFGVLLILFHLLEEALLGLIHGETLSQSLSSIAGGKLSGIAMVGIIMFFVLIPFFAFEELQRAIGAEEFRFLLLGRRSGAGHGAGRQEFSRTARHDGGHADGASPGRARSRYRRKRGS
jgi:hypothetical protein